MTATPTNYPPMASRDIRHKAIRQALKVAFPAVKFSITGSRGTGYGWTHIGWTDGPSVCRVDANAHRFFGESFNGMTDGYDATDNYFEYEGTVYAAGGSGFLTERRISPAFARRLLAAVVAKYGDFNTPAIIETTDYKGRPDWKLSDYNSSPILNGGNYCRAHTHADLMHQAAYDRTTVEG
jgi:hypothetical protein